MSTSKNPIIQKMVGITVSQYNQVTQESQRLSESTNTRVSDSEVIRRAIDFYFSHKDEVE